MYTINNIIKVFIYHEKSANPNKDDIDNVNKYHGKLKTSPN